MHELIRVEKKFAKILTHHWRAEVVSEVGFPLARRRKRFGMFENTVRFVPLRVNCPEMVQRPRLRLQAPFFASMIRAIAVNRFPLAPSVSVVGCLKSTGVAISSGLWETWRNEKASFGSDGKAR